MNTITTFVVAQMLLLQDHITAQSTREREEGSQTTDNLLWVIAVIAIAGIAVYALTSYVQSLAGQIG